MFGTKVNDQAFGPNIVCLLIYSLYSEGGKKKKKKKKKKEKEKEKKKQKQFLVSFL